MVLCIGICHGRRKKVMSIATAHARQAWPLKIMLIIFLCACLLDESASMRLASRQAWLSLAKVMSRSIANGKAKQKGAGSRRRSGRDACRTGNPGDAIESANHSGRGPDGVRRDERE